MGVDVAVGVVVGRAVGRWLWGAERASVMLGGGIVGEMERRSAGMEGGKVG